MKIRSEQNRSLLRFTTAGSVDDGKSTLIGRLLYDSKSIFEDQLEHIIQSGKRLGRDDMDLSLLTDGLRAEREQGITIDVAYRYFATPARKFIIADTPGHVQYTRNMVTGASTADVALILIDARKGVLEQTIRHTFIASLLDIRHIVFCINKMDMIGWSEQEYLKVKSGLDSLVEKLKISDASYIPVSAKYGDNVVSKSPNMEWYKGAPLLQLLETMEISPKNSEISRFPVQTVIRTDKAGFHDYRAYAGRVAGGKFSKGDEVTILPALLKSRISHIEFAGNRLDTCLDGDCVSIILEDEIDIGRGDLIVSKGNFPEINQEFDLVTCWFNSQPLTEGGRYLIRLNNIETRCIVKSIRYKINLSTLENDPSDITVRMNDLARVSVKTSQPVFFDSYKINNTTGSMIFIDEVTNETAGAGMIV
jgi:sulfate adenylyltransferase subunit 1